MSDEENGKDELAADPETAGAPTTSPDVKAPDKWEMPKPVFQQTSGYLPQGFVKQIQHSGTVNVPPETSAGEAAPAEQPPDASMDEPSAVSSESSNEASPASWEMPDEPAAAPAAAPQGQADEPLAAVWDLSSQPAVAPLAAAAPATAVGQIEPQPSLSDAFTLDENLSVPSAAAPRKSSALPTVMIVLGVVAITVFLAVLLAALVYFLSRRGEVNNF